MSNANQETIADIVAEMRLGVKDWKGERLGVFDCFADRIEAAHQREVAELKSKMNDVVCENEALRDACGTCGAKREREATREKPSQVSNAAKTREALSDACYAMFNFLKTQNGGYEEMAKALDKAKAALAEPPRNCDVGTDEEQSRRYEELCYRHTCGSRCSASGCPMYEYDCSPFAWGQMPYEEGGAK